MEGKAVFFSWPSLHRLIPASAKIDEAGTALPYLQRQHSLDPCAVRSNGEVLGTAGKNCRLPVGFLWEKTEDFWGTCPNLPKNSWELVAFIYFFKPKKLEVVKVARKHEIRKHLPLILDISWALRQIDDDLPVLHCYEKDAPHPLAR